MSGGSGDNQPAGEAGGSGDNQPAGEAGGSGENHLAGEASVIENKIEPDLTYIASRIFWKEICHFNIERATPNWHPCLHSQPIFRISPFPCFPLW